MSIFETGKILKTDFGAPIKILKYLASGGQGDVYIVEYGGKKKALKWYKNAGNDPNAFYDNLKRNADKGSPDKAFLWPEAVTEKTEGSFGYIMDLRPDGYHELSEFMLARDVKFPSFKAAVEACIKIVSAFRMLHNNGYSYQDLNDGNFFINPKTGDVLICDNDNVAPNGTNMGIIGKPRYMAPEIVTGKGKVLPNTQTDRFSLAIILFLLLCMNHPLEGAKSLVPCLTPLDAEKIYGSEALFICDLDDKSNRPVRNIHQNVIARWGYMPEYIKDAFFKSFCQQAIKEPNKRLKELDWLKVLVRFRSDIVKCNCGNEVFVKNATTTICDGCKKPLNIVHSLKLPDYSITAAKGSRIYRCQLGICNADTALTPIALVVAKPDNPNALGVKNMTAQIWKATTPSGKAKQVQPQEVIPFKQGIVIEVYDSKIELQ
jgi:DNA-binding helix-hairpin-helix protein with protein kinase domain